MRTGSTTTTSSSWSRPWATSSPDLRRHFAVEIVVTDKSLCDETYYASFINNESLDEILDALNKDRLFSVRREAEVYYISPPLK